QGRGGTASRPHRVCHEPFESLSHLIAVPDDFALAVNIERECCVTESRQASAAFAIEVIEAGRFGRNEHGGTCPGVCILDGEVPNHPQAVAVIGNSAGVYH